MTPTTAATINSAPVHPLPFWYTDRSRYTLGVGKCARARYLQYHAGPTGYGWVRGSESLPLVTGNAAHEILAGFAGILQTTDQLPTIHETRAVITTAVQSYVARVEARGYRGILAGPQTDETLQEQSALISGIGWAMRLTFLPWLYQTFEVVSVEQEDSHFLTCTCAGGTGLTPAEHAARGCQGIVLSQRLDLIARRRGGNTLAYLEAKTTGWESPAWVDQWETNPQLGLGTLDAQTRYGAEVTELYVLALQKGRRAYDAWEEKETGVRGRRKQQSPLVYGYCRPGNPPLAPDDWLPTWEWKNEVGESKRASKAHRRRGVWELRQSDWPIWQMHAATDPEVTPEEFWVRQLPKSVLEKVCAVLGPFNRQDAQISSLRTSMAAEEARWQSILWELFEAQTTHGEGWADDAFQDRLDRLVPQSWNCRPFGRDHECEYVPICHRQGAWQDLALMGYQPRRPHHTPELEQAVGRGLLVEEAVEVEEE